MSALETVRDDDFVEYFLFVRPDDNKSDKEEFEEHIKYLNTKVLKLVAKLSEQYIWHKDQFNLIPRFCTTLELQQSFPDTPEGNVYYLLLLLINYITYFVILILLLGNCFFNVFDCILSILFKLLRICHRSNYYHCLTNGYIAKNVFLEFQP